MIKGETGDSWKWRTGGGMGLWGDSRIFKYSKEGGEERETLVLRQKGGEIAGEIASKSQGDHVAYWARILVSSTHQAK